MLQVLIIDDDEIVLMIQEKFIQKCGISKEILSFKGGQKALDYLLNRRDDSGILILLDVNMPGMNGWQFLDKLESVQANQHTYVVMVSSSIIDMDKEVEENYKRVIGFIEKPVSIRDCEKIRNFPQLKEFV